MRILVVEDDPAIAKLLSDGLTEAGYTVDHAADGVQGLNLATLNSYASAVVDIMLPRLDGLSLVERLRTLGQQLPVLILSAKQSVDDRLKGFQSGGDDYLIKPFAFAELLARLQSLLRRAQGSAEATRLTVGPLAVDLLRREVRRGDKLLDLQPREFDLLVYLMRNAGRVVSRDMLVRNVWDFNFDPQTNVVDARVCRLRDKIDKGFDVPLIQTVRGVGYVLRTDA